MSESTFCCASCGYDLRTLEFSGRCPECGTKIAESIRTRLDHADPLFVQTCMWGVTLLMCSLIAASTASTFWLIMPVLPEDFAGDALSSLISTLWQLQFVEPFGIWLLLIAERGTAQSRSHETWRRILLFIGVAAFVRHWLIYQVPQIDSWWNTASALLAIGASFAIFWRMRELVRRADRALDVHVTSVYAITVAVTVLVSGVQEWLPVPEFPRGLAAVVVLAAVSYTLYVEWRVRKMLIENARRARENWHDRMHRQPQSPA